MIGIGNAGLWAGFAAFVVATLVVDFVALGRRGSERVSTREAATWSAVWVALSLAFAAALWLVVGRSQGREAADAATIAFVTGYLVEKSLAIDNVFVFLTIFTAFAVPDAHRKRVLMIGIVAAIVLRAAMIFGGAALIARFEWILLVFGVFLVVTGVRLWRSVGEPVALDEGVALRLLRRLIPVSRASDGERLVTWQDGRRVETPLFLVVALIGVTDVIFAVDSIPAVFAITTDPFLVLTSNVFAVLGLHAMYFLLADLVDRFHLLPYGLAVVLVFVGAKMVVAEWLHVPPLVSLGVIVGVLATTVVASVRSSAARPGQAPDARTQ